MGSSMAWTIGGGTILYDLFAHRHSRDIEIFVSDPQILLFLTPRSNEVAEQVANAGSYVESSNFIKFVTQAGEIDFIVAPRLTSPYAIPRGICGHRAMVETPVEILATKVLYRAESFTARDISDLVFAMEARRRTRRASTNQFRDISYFTYARSRRSRASGSIVRSVSESDSPHSFRSAFCPPAV